MKAGQIHLLGIGGTLRENSTSRWVLRRALQGSQTAGATTELLDLRQLNLPIAEPRNSPKAYGPNVAQLIHAARRATRRSGVRLHISEPSQAVQRTHWISSNSRPATKIPISTPRLWALLLQRVATAAVNAVNALVHVVHALRGTAAPLHEAVPQAWRVFDEDGKVVDPKWDERLDLLGQLVVEMAGKLSPKVRPLRAEEQASAVA